MRIALTGGTGFIGRYLLRQLANEGHQIRAWYRESSDRSGLDDIESSIEWRTGKLGARDDAKALVEGCDAVVHAAFSRSGRGFQHSEADVVDFCQTNIIGSLQLIDAAKEAGVKRFVFVSTCAVHDKILGGRPLDETHPTWAASHYGAYKAAVEQFVYSFGLGHEFPVCAVRPTGVYGVDHPVERSKWFDLVGQVVRGETVKCESGGKEVHAADVAQAVALMLGADEQRIRGEVFNCCDRYVAEHDVATLAKKFSGSNARIEGHVTAPKNQIETGKIQALGMQFGGQTRLESTIEQLVNAHRS